MKSGDRLGTWTLVNPLEGGRGGNGTVWEVVDIHGRTAALKILRRTNGEGRMRFAREVDAMKRCSDIQGVMPLLDAETDLTQPIQWYTMPLAEPLSQLAAQMQSLEETVKVCSSLAATLAELHARGYSHRDIKPENVLRLDGRWYLGDFGLVDHAEAAALTPDDKKLGPMFYIAPEMLNSPATANGTAADVYSLAKLLWKLATAQNYPNPGRHDRFRPAMTISAWINNASAVSLDALIDTMTDDDPSRRPSAEMVKVELDNWLSRDSLLVPRSPVDLTEVTERMGRLTEVHRTRLSGLERNRERVKTDTERIYKRVREVLAPMCDELRSKNVGHLSPSHPSGLTGLGSFAVGGPNGRNLNGRRLQFATRIPSHRGMVELVGRADLVQQTNEGEVDPDKPVTFSVEYLLTVYPHREPPRPSVSLWRDQETFLTGLPAEEAAMGRLLAAFSSTLLSSLTTAADALAQLGN